MTVHIIASPGQWIEGEAERQLRATAALPGMKLAVGMPDLHPGKGSPIGAAFVSEDILYPNLVGSDIGCGMALWRTDAAVRVLKQDKAVRRLAGLDGPWDGDTAAWLAADGVEPSGHEASLGTIGGGNHFAELQAPDVVADPAAFAALGLVPDRLVLLVHSGSRGFGEAVLRAHAAIHGASGLPAGEAAAAAYLARHDHAVAWARSSRRLIAHRFATALGVATERVLDVCHNSVVPTAAFGCRCWLHRKGAAPADQGPVVIPGSRGTLSYLVRPVGDQVANAASLAHGAGRKWRRSEARERLERRFTPEALRRTPLGGRVVCEDKNLLYEEAPPAYKDVDRVVGDLVDAGLVTIVATLRPVITYKTRGGRT